MALIRPRQEVIKPRAVTAATAVIPLGAESSWKTWKFKAHEWQAEAWRLYDIVGELRFLANWIGDSVSQAHLYVTEVNENGEETGPTEQEAIGRLAAFPFGTGAQRDDNLRLTGIDLAVPGEGWIVVENWFNLNEQIWYVLTNSQIERKGDRIIVCRPRFAGGERIELQRDKDLLIRMWRPHPNSIDEADSPTRAAIPPLREIELLTKREFAELESRLTGAGLMFMPEGFDYPRGEDDPEDISGFMAFLQRAVAKAIQNQADASALVPIMATIPDQFIEHLDKLKPITFWSELSSQITDMKEKAIGRVAASFEIPSELLSGLGDANHWTAWAISEEGIKRIRPYLATVADALTRGFLQPYLQAAKVENWQRFVYAFDTAPLAVRPNRMDEALQLWDRFLITDGEAVRSGAFSEEQMPDETERLKMLAFRAVSQRPELLMEPDIRSVIGFPRVSISAAPERRAIEAPSEIQDSQDIPSTLDDGMPTTQTGLTASAGPDMVVAVGEALVYRALEMAGWRLTTPGERRHKWADVPSHDLHTRVGPVSYDKAEKVLKGAWDRLPKHADRVGVDSDRLQHALSTYCIQALMHGRPYSERELRNELDNV